MTRLLDLSAMDRLDSRQRAVIDAEIPEEALLLKGASRLTPDMGDAWRRGPRKRP